MKLKSKNDRTILISNKDSAEEDLSSWIPHVVVLTAWERERAIANYWKSLLVRLLSKGTKYIACIGIFSQVLHDEIDEMLYKLIAEQPENEEVDVITTHHENDSIEEAIDYCVYGTDTANSGAGCIIAILDVDSQKDQRVKSSLQNA